MKTKSLYLLFFLTIISIAFYGCEKNDPLTSLGEIGEFTANIYFIPISPLADAGSIVKCEIEYWTVGDEFLEESLMEEISTSFSYEIDYADADYTFDFELDTTIIEERVYENYSFEFTNWNPERNAYVVRPSYEVKEEYSKISLTEKNTDANDFIQYFIPEMIEDFHSTLVDLLGEEGCKEILTNTYAVIDEASFDQNVISDNNFEEQEKSYCMAKLAQVNIDLLIGENYKYSNTTNIGLRYKIRNGLGTEAQSYQRNISIK